jgi:hypothetical protein
MDTDEPAVPTWGPLGVAGDSPVFPGPGVRDEPAVGGQPHDADDDADKDDERPSHPYTWLQLTVLALVAFVLGFLIVLLASRGSSASTPASTPAAAAAAQVTISTPLVV